MRNRHAYDQDQVTVREHRRLSIEEKEAIQRRAEEKARIAKNGTWQERRAVQMAACGHGVRAIVAAVHIPEEQALIIVTGRLTL